MLLDLAKGFGKAGNWIWQISEFRYTPPPRLDQFWPVRVPFGIVDAAFGPDIPVRSHFVSGHGIVRKQVRPVFLP